MCALLKKDATNCSSQHEQQKSIAIKYHLRRIIRCEEFEGELASIREDVIDSLEDGWVVKSVCYISGHHDHPRHHHVHPLVMIINSLSGGRESMAAFCFLQQATFGCLSQRGAACFVRW